MSGSNFWIQEHVLPGQHIREYPGGTANEQEETLKIHIRQYTPLSNPDPKPGDITIVGAHANGFPKELYEPLWDDILAKAKKAGIRIRNIWIADSAQQGRSGVINERHLGNDPGWLDHSRDLLCMVNHFRAQMIRPLVGIGHSLGATQLVGLSLMHPRLFATVLLIEPVLLPMDIVLKSNTGAMFAKLSSMRRDIWPSRQEASKLMLKSKFYQAWDKRVFERWIRFGLRDLPTSLFPIKPAGQPNAVTLATTKHQEVFVYVRHITSDWDRNSYPDIHPDLIAKLRQTQSPFYATAPVKMYELLPYVRPSVAFIIGARSFSAEPVSRKYKVEQTGTKVGGSGGAKEGRVKEIFFENGTHFIPFEQVEECAEVIVDWVVQIAADWREEEEAFNGKWQKLTPLEKVTMSEELKKDLKAKPNL